MRKFLIYDSFGDDTPLDPTRWIHSVEALRARAAAVRFTREKDIPQRIVSEGGVYFLWVGEDHPDNLHPNGSPIGVHQFQMIYTPSREPTAFEIGDWVRTVETGQIGKIVDIEPVGDTPLKVMFADAVAMAVIGQAPEEALSSDDIGWYALADVSLHPTPKGNR